MKNKALFTALIVAASGLADASELTRVHGSNDQCDGIQDYLSDFLKGGSFLVHRVSDNQKAIRLIGHGLKEKFNISSEEVAAIRGTWFKYLDIDNDGTKELFATYSSYQNTYTLNVSSIYVFDIDKNINIESVLSDQYRSEDYSDFQAYLIQNYNWDRYKGPDGASSALPKEIILTPSDGTEIRLRSGAGFNEPPNDYILNVFTAQGKNYVLVHGTNNKEGNEYVVEIEDLRDQKYSLLCHFEH